MKTVSDYAWGAQGGGDTPATGATFKKVSTITSGKQYLLVASGKAALLDTRDYGYLQVADVTDNGGTITADAANAYTIEATTGGYTIKMSNGHYLYQTGTYNSFNFSDAPSEGNVWAITAQGDGSFKIINVSTSKFIQYDSQYNSYGCYSDSKGVMPALYEKQ